MTPPSHEEHTMRQVIGVITTCPGCGKQHVETLANARLEKVTIYPKGEIVEMAVTAGEQVFGGGMEDMLAIGRSP